MRLFKHSLTKYLSLTILALIFSISASAAPKQIAILPSANQQSNHWIQLNWNSNSPTDDVTGYNVYRSVTNGSGYVKITVTAIPNTVFRDDGTTHGTTYYYVVTAVNSAGESGNSSQISVTP